ncbi:GTPase Era [Hyphobacterium marinum]|uniref:GTPase Era n=1 Tax=Hyphobacterium marinum TaxID=3116574 RepID=A0ABU7LYS2_9PROT|nr:GTPase Era [Hyphobacterium sp. Y6023]MEE2566706.1 GTPase Era [Hyphobacterium sp. Y6023]
MTTETKPTRAGFAAIIGAPNAGKSTLTNALVGEKVSIVTRKVQTTRFPVRGVAMLDAAQIILVDTPGVFAPRRRLDRSMVQAAWAGAQDADVIVHVIDAAGRIADAAGKATGAQKRCVEDDDRVIEGLKDHGQRAILALNKIDLVRRDELLAAAQALHETGVYSDIFMLSAETGDGVADLKKVLAKAMPEGPFLYPEDQAADIPQRVMAAEITREKLYLRLHEELPYMATVETESWQPRKDGSVRIEQTIYVERDSQRPIVLGKKGATIKTIGELARTDMEDAFGCRVHLFLNVQVQPGWADNRNRYTAMGLEFDV